MPLPAHLYRAAIHALALVPPADIPGVYATSFLICDEEDDPRRPTLAIGYNTEGRVRQALAAQRRSHLLPAGWPSDEGEARWNYAFWLQNELAVIGHGTRDPAGARLCEAWIKGHGWWYTEPDGNTDDDWAPVRPMIEQITRNFVSLCVRTARRLHNDGIIQQTFSRPVPVLIHELEYYDQIAGQTEDANPPGLAEAFTSWIRNL